MVIQPLLKPIFFSRFNKIKKAKLSTDKELSNGRNPIQLTLFVQELQTKQCHFLMKAWKNKPPHAM